MDKIVDTQFLQLQHDSAQVRPQNLGVCVVQHLVCEGLFCVEAEGLAFACTACTSCSLVCAGFRDRRHQQRLNTDTWVVHLLFGKSRIDDVHNPVDGQRSFCNVGRNDNLAPGRTIWPVGRRRVKNHLLHSGGKGGVKWNAQHLPNVSAHVSDCLADFFARVFDFFLARQKEQDVPTFFLHLMDLDDCPDCGHQVVLLRFLRVKLLDLKCAPGYFDKWAAGKVVLELFSVQCGTHDDNL